MGDINQISAQIMKVHGAWPGLLESAGEGCLLHELRERV
jgi:hypothetical protein